MTTYETNLFVFAPCMDCLYSNHHLYLPLYLNIMQWGPTCFLDHESSPDTSLRLRWISLLIHSFADPSRHHLPDPGVIIWPRSDTLTLGKREDQFYDNSSRRCLTQSARLHLLRISSWPRNRGNILPSKQKENHQKNVTNKFKNFSVQRHFAHRRLKQKCLWQ